MIDVESEVTYYDRNGSETAGKITVASHWNRDKLVVLEIDGAVYTMAAKDLRAAIKNATNSAKF